MLYSYEVRTKGGVKHCVRAGAVLAPNMAAAVRMVTDNYAKNVAVYGEIYEIDLVAIPDDVVECHCEEVK